MEPFPKIQSFSAHQRVPLLSMNTDFLQVLDCYKVVCILHIRKIELH